MHEAGFFCCRWRGCEGRSRSSALPRVRALAQKGSLPTLASRLIIRDPTTSLRHHLILSIPPRTQGRSITYPSLQSTTNWSLLVHFYVLASQPSSIHRIASHLARRIFGSHPSIRYT